MIKIYLYKIIFSKYPVLLVNGFALLLMYCLLIIPQQQHLEETQLNFSRVSSELQQQAAQIQRMSDDKQKLDVLNQEWHTLKESGIQSPEINNIFTDLETLAKQSNVDLYYETVNQIIRITLESDYISLLNFIDNIIQYPHFLLNDLQLKRQSGVIITTIDLHILLADEHV